MEPMLTIGIILLSGFLAGELISRIGLPKVTGYILAGIVLNPSVSGIIPQSFPEHTDWVTHLALAFITFAVGGTLAIPTIRKQGKTILTITLLEAEMAFLMIIIGLAALGPWLVDVPANGFLTFLLPLAILIGSLGSPTDPSATLAVAHEYKAKGEVSDTIMGVAAFDDALGIINYSFALVIAQVLVSHQTFSAGAAIGHPLLVVLGSVAGGMVFGFVFCLVKKALLGDSSEGVLIVFTAGALCSAFGVANLVGLDPLMMTMLMGAFVVNYLPRGDKVFAMLERYTEALIFVLFFTLSGMHLDFSVLAKTYWLVLVFVLCRGLGKFSGTYLGARFTRASDKVRKYTAGGLIPQGGIVIGLALMIHKNPAFDSFADIIISVIIGATVIHELIGPVFAKLTLKRAHEMGRSS